MKKLFVAGTVLTTALSVTAAEKTEWAKFNRSYASASAAERKAALALLPEAENSAIDVLIHVAQNDKDASVCLEAFKRLAAFPAQDDRIAKTLASLFRAVPQHQKDWKVSYANAMRNSAFKYAITEALVEYAFETLRFPDEVSGSDDVLAGSTKKRSQPQESGPIGPLSREASLKDRADFIAFMASFDAITGRTSEKLHRLSFRDVKKWWDENRSKVAQGDRELHERLVRLASEKAEEMVVGRRVSMK
ncbi:MAG TPA: hypothetical protein VEK08_06210 [Planctomycetota bacterium]|nr:hypothetical protein [Planctomycetota bacterium]